MVSEQKGGGWLLAKRWLYQTEFHSQQGRDNDSQVGSSSPRQLYVLREMECTGQVECEGQAIPRNT